MTGLNKILGKAIQFAVFFFVTFVFVGQINAESMEELKSGVLRITSEVEGIRKVGTGFIVKIDSTGIYAITASHVVEGDPAPKVNFFSQPRNDIEAQIVGTDVSNPKGVATLLIQEDITFSVQVLDFSQETIMTGGQEIAIIGFPIHVGVPWAVSSGNIVGRNGPDIVFAAFTDEGHSGSPLLLNGKIAGVVTGTVGAVGFATPVGTTVESLLGWGISFPKTPKTGRETDHTDSNVDVEPSRHNTIEPYVTDEVGLAGSIDWSEGTVSAVGIGAPPPDIAVEAQAQYLAKRAAITIALGNLLEKINGIHVRKHTTVKGNIIDKVELTTKVEGVIKGAFVAKEKPLPGGLYQVTVETNLDGELSPALIPSRSDKNEAISIPPKRETLSVPPIKEFEATNEFTGLIVDTRGLDVRPALLPRIFLEDGREVYPLQIARETAVQEGVVGYTKNIETAKSDERVRPNPLVIKALKVVGERKTDLVISDSDAQILFSDSNNLKFLEKARVILVFD